MNRSGISVQKTVAQESFPANHVLVVCDDLNLEFGRMRIRQKGSDGGHNGLASIITALASDDFPRLRLGIGKPDLPQGQGTVDYVLGRFSSGEKKELGPFISHAADCCLAWLSQDLSQVMSQFNKRKENG